LKPWSLKRSKPAPDIRDVRKRYTQNYFFMKKKLEPRPLRPLSDDLSEAIRRRKEKEEIYAHLPKIDCGICGSPSCLTFAEDVIMEEADLSDCIFKLPQRFRQISQEFLTLLEKALSPNAIRSTPAGISKNKEEK